MTMPTNYVLWWADKPRTRVTVLSSLLHRVLAGLDQLQSTIIILY